MPPAEFMFAYENFAYLFIYFSKSFAARARSRQLFYTLLTDERQRTREKFISFVYFRPLIQTIRQILGPGICAVVDHFNHV